MKSGGYSEGVTITKKLKISSAKVGEGIISSDTVPFSLIDNADVQLYGLTLKNWT